MIYIVLHHFIAHALPLSTVYSTALGIEWDITQILNAFCYCAVNVYVLISGVFGIHPKFKSFLNLYLMCAFYVFVLYHFHLYEIGSHINRWSVLYTLMPFSYNPGWWFIMCYVLLYILSPILNAAITSFDKRKFEYALVLLTIVNLYFGFYRSQDFVNYGYSINHFIYLYFIGAYLKRYMISTNTHLNRWRWSLLATYVIGSLIFGVLTILNTKYLHNNTNVWLYTLNYNHPLLIINSIALLLLFFTFQIQSRVINYIAQSVLAVYLLHECSWFSANYYHTIASFWESISSPVLRIGLLFILCIVVFLFGVAFDSIRRLITYPIAKCINKGYEICKQRILAK